MEFQIMTLVLPLGDGLGETVQSFIIDSECILQIDRSEGGEVVSACRTPSAGEGVAS